MSVQAMSLFFALLSLLVVAGLIALIVDALTPADLSVVRFLRPVALEAGAAIATGSVLGSLYMSEIAGYTPCRLCWIQRYFMYPAALILIVAVVTKRSVLRFVALALALPGICVSIFHRYEQAVGHSGEFCDPTNPCSDIFVREFGYITIPTMAAIGFAGVIAMVLLHPRKVA